MDAIMERLNRHSWIRFTLNRGFSFSTMIRKGRPVSYLVYENFWRARSRRRWCSCVVWVQHLYEKIRICSRLALDRKIKEPIVRRIRRVSRRDTYCSYVAITWIPAWMSTSFTHSNSKHSHSQYTSSKFSTRLFAIGIGREIEGV
jgi:hypothetical protein